MWFKTHENQILKTENIESFWIECSSDYKVFCQDKDKIHWTLGVFNSLEEASEYLDEIYTFVGVL